MHICILGLYGTRYLVFFLALSPSLIPSLWTGLYAYMYISQVIMGHDTFFIFGPCPFLNT